MPVSLLAIAYCHNAGLAIKWVIFSRVLKWYGSFTTALFKLVGSRHIQSFRLPSLSLSSTSMKLFIQGVASWIGLIIPALSILSPLSWMLLLNEQELVYMEFVSVLHQGQPVCGMEVLEIYQYLQKCLDSWIGFVLYLWLTCSYLVSALYL